MLWFSKPSEAKHERQNEIGCGPNLKTSRIRQGSISSMEIKIQHISAMTRHGRSNFQNRKWHIQTADPVRVNWRSGFSRTPLIAGQLRPSSPPSKASTSCLSLFWFQRMNILNSKQASAAPAILWLTRLDKLRTNGNFALWYPACRATFTLPTWKREGEGGSASRVALWRQRRIQSPRVVGQRGVWKPPDVRRLFSQASEHPRSQGLFPTLFSPRWGGGIGKRPWERGWLHDQWKGKEGTSSNKGFWHFQ